jgi:hypothetical protein
VTGLGRAGSYQVTRAHPVMCTTRGPAGRADSSPDDTTVRLVPSQTRRQDQSMIRTRPVFTGQVTRVSQQACKDCIPRLGRLTRPEPGGLTGPIPRRPRPSSPQASRWVGWDGRLVCGTPSGWRCTLPAHLRLPASHASGLPAASSSADGMTVPSVSCRSASVPAPQMHSCRLISVGGGACDACGLRLCPRVPPGR